MDSSLVTAFLSPLFTVNGEQGGVHREVLNSMPTLIAANVVLVGQASPFQEPKQ